MLMLYQLKKEKTKSSFDEVVYKANQTKKQNRDKNLNQIKRKRKQSFGAYPASCPKDTGRSFPDGEAVWA